MSDLQLLLSDEEKIYLVGVLETALCDTRVEARHTRTEDFREKVRHEAELLQGLLTKLK